MRKKKKRPACLQDYSDIEAAFLNLLLVCVCIFTLNPAPSFRLLAQDPEFRFRLCLGFISFILILEIAAMRAWTRVLLGASFLGAVAAYWMEDILHQGLASFNPNSKYRVFRNVKDYGARGDGVTDDTAAINAAISDGDRCGFYGDCHGATTTPALVYFPAGSVLSRRNVCYCGPAC